MAILSPILLRELSILGFLLYATYSSVFGTLLGVFVPQSCPTKVPVNSTSFIGGRNVTSTIFIVQGSHECRLEENVYIEINDYNKFVLAMNFFSLLLILIG